MAERFVAVSIYSHQLKLLRRPYREVLRANSNGEFVNQTHLTSCLDNCKKFFDYLLSLPEFNFLDFTVVQWGYMVQVILVISRLTFLMASSLGWDSDATRSNIPLPMYIDCLCYRLQQLSSTPTNGPDLPKNPDILYVFQKVLGSVKKSYLKRVSNIKPSAEKGTLFNVARGHCPVMDPTLGVYFDAVDSTYGSSFDILGGGGGSGTSSVAPSTAPLYHDLWATMTGSWAVEM